MSTDVPKMDPNKYLKLFAAENGLSISEAKKQLQAKFGDPKGGLFSADGTTNVDTFTRTTNNADNENKKVKNKTTDSTNPDTDTKSADDDFYEYLKNAKGYTDEQIKNLSASEIQKLQKEYDQKVSDAFHKYLTDIKGYSDEKIKNLTQSEIKKLMKEMKEYNEKNSNKTNNENNSNKTTNDTETKKTSNTESKKSSEKADDAAFYNYLRYTKGFSDAKIKSLSQSEINKYKGEFQARVDEEIYKYLRKQGYTDAQIQAMSKKEIKAAYKKMTESNPFS